MARKGTLALHRCHAYVIIDKSDGEERRQTVKFSRPDDGHSAHTEDRVVAGGKMHLHRSSLSIILYTWIRGPFIVK